MMLSPFPGITSQSFYHKISEKSLGFIQKSKIQKPSAEPFSSSSAESYISAVFLPHFPARRFSYHQRRQRLWRHLLRYISLNKSTSMRFCRPLPWGGLPGGGGGGPQPGPGGGGGGPQPGFGGGPQPGPGGLLCSTRFPARGISSAFSISSSIADSACFSSFSW